MARTTLHDKTSNDHNLPRKRMLLDYVDPYAGSDVKVVAPLDLKSEKQAPDSLRRLVRHTRAKTALRHENEPRKEPESWEGLSPAQPGLDPLPSNFQGPVASTPKNRRRGPRKPLHPITPKPPSPLPPSSPPSPSSQDKDVTEALEDEEEGDDTDPFGFLAAEKRLKARKAPRPSPQLQSKLSMGGNGSVDSESSVGEAFATQDVTGHDESDELVTFISHGRKRPAPTSPSASSIRTKSEPSSPCQQTIRRIRRKSDAGNAKQEEKAKAKAKKGNRPKPTDEDPRLITLELEALLPKRPGKGARQQGRAKKAGKVVDGKRGIRGDKQKTKGVRKTGLSDLDDEDREKLEREREERLRYYRRLDTYHIAQEKVWVV